MRGVTEILYRLENDSILDQPSTLSFGVCFMATQQKKPINPYNYDPMSPGSGAFKALTRDLLQGFDVVRGGITFAVSGNFKHLTVAQFLQYSGGAKDVHQAMNIAHQYWDYHRDRNIKAQVYFPTQEAAVIAGITPAIGVGGMSHEAGHPVCDMAGHNPCWSSAKRLYGDLITKCIDLGIWGQVCQILPKWSNLTADIRLERMMGHMYPNTITRFHAIQKWIHGMELPTRKAQKFGDHLMCGIRDFGKGWGNPVWTEYTQEARDEVMRLSPLIKQLWTEGQSIEDTVHLPVQVALELLIELNEQSLLPPDDGQGGDGDEGEGQGGEGTMSDPCDGDGDEGQGEGQGDQGDDQGEGEGQGEGRGEYT